MISLVQYIFLQFVIKKEIFNNILINFAKNSGVYYDNIHNLSIFVIIRRDKFDY